MTRNELRQVRIGTVLKRQGFRRSYETLEVVRFVKDATISKNQIVVVGKWMRSWSPDAEPVEVRWAINSKDIILEKV